MTPSTLTGHRRLTLSEIDQILAALDDRLDKLEVRELYPSDIEWVPANAREDTASARRKVREMAQ